jgi:hypothetical protein
MQLGVNQENIVVSRWAKLMKKIQPVVPSFLAVAIPFVAQYD